MVDAIGNGYRVMVMGDLNGGLVVERRMVAGAFGVDGKSENG